MFYYHINIACLPNITEDGVEPAFGRNSLIVDVAPLPKQFAETSAALAASTETAVRDALFKFLMNSHPVVEDPPSEDG